MANDVTVALPEPATTTIDFACHVLPDGAEVANAALVFPVSPMLAPPPSNFVPAGHVATDAADSLLKVLPLFTVVPVTIDVAATVPWGPVAPWAPVAPCGPPAPWGPAA